MANVIVRSDPKGLERGSGGTKETVGMHGGGLTISLELDGCYADARKRWESELSDEEREGAIQRERAVRWYYTSIILEGDPEDKEGSYKEIASTMDVLQRCGWVVNHQDISMMGPTVVLSAEMKREKTSAELAL